MRKTILLAMPKIARLDQLIEAALHHHGFNVINIVYDDIDFRYPSLKTNLYAKYRKLIYKDTITKKKIKWQALQNKIATKIAKSGGLDYALFISGDIYSREFIQFIRKQTRQIVVNYQCDGLNRFPDMEALIVEFDRFFAFDPKDADQDRGILTTSNFYFDHLDVSFPKSEYDFYFTGVHDLSRVSSINAFARYAAENGYTMDLNILWKYAEKRGRQYYPGANIKLIKDCLDFNENVQRASKARVLLDFVSSDHRGLSFRVFEALANNKKLITTNEAVRAYDFYCSDNIFVWNGSDLNGLDEFLAKPYQMPTAEIKQKYSFGNWIRYVLNQSPYIKMDLPIEAEHE